MPIETRTTPTACASGSREQRDDGDLRRLIETAAETIERADWAVAVFTESYESFALTVSASCGDRRAARATLREAFSTYRSDLRPLPTVFPIAREHEASLALVIGVLAKGVAVATFARSTRAPSEASNKADASALLSFAADRSDAFERVIRTASERFALTIARRRMRPGVVVLDRSLRVVGSNVVAALDDSRTLVDDGILHARVREVVENMRSELRDHAASDDATTLAICDSLLLRLHRLSGKAGYVLVVEPFRERNYLASAVERFGFSTREVDVLTRLLDGHSVARIAADLYLAPSTVEYHLRHLFEKTEARHRSNLVARVLGWPEVGDSDRDDDVVDR